jgi:hypothetical protein
MFTFNKTFVPNLSYTYLRVGFQKVHLLLKDSVNSENHFNSNSDLIFILYLNSTPVFRPVRFDLFSKQNILTL